MALVRQLGFTRMSFAAPIKEALNAMFGWHPGNWDDREWKEEDLESFKPNLVSPRLLAQTLGTEWGRDLDPDFWVKTLEHRWLARETGTNLVISDVRLDTEARRTCRRRHQGLRHEGGRPQ